MFRLVWPLLCCTLLLVSAFPVPANAQPGNDEDLNRAQLLRRIVQRHADLYVGLRDADALHSLVIVGTHVQDGTTFRMQLRRKRPDLLRYSLRNDFVQIDAGFDGRNGWLRTDRDGVGAVVPLSGPQLDALRREADFVGPLLRLRNSQSGAIELLGSRRVAGSDSYGLRTTGPDGDQVVYYLERQSAYLLRTEILDREGAVRLQTDYSDYRIVGGFPLAFKVENRVGTEVVSTTTLSEVEVNTGLLSFLFSAPAR